MPDNSFPTPHSFDNKPYLPDVVFQGRTRIRNPRLLKMKLFNRIAIVLLVSMLGLALPASPAFAAKTTTTQHTRKGKKHAAKKKHHGARKLAHKKHAARKAQKRASKNR